MKLFALSIILSLILVAPGYGKDGTSVFTLSHIAEAPTGDTREMSLKFGNSVEKVFVDQTVLLNDKEIASATLIEGTPVRIQIKLTNDGREKLENITKYSVGKRLAIILDGQLVSAPTIRTEISGGILEIAGNLDQDTAEKLVIALNRNTP